jgi:hypothetical protein
MAMVMKDAYHTGGCAVEILQNRLRVELPRQYQLSESALRSRLVLKGPGASAVFAAVHPELGPDLKISL